MRQRGDIAAVTLLAQQFVDEGFVNTEQFGDLTFASDLTFHSANYSFSIRSLRSKE